MGSMLSGGAYGPVREELGQMDRTDTREVGELDPAGHAVGEYDGVLAGRAHRREQRVLGDGGGDLVVTLLHAEVPGQAAAAADPRHRGTCLGQQRRVGLPAE